MAAAAASGGLLLVAWLHPEARALSLAAAGLALLLGLFSLRRSSSRLRSALPGARALSIWPDFGTKNVVEALREPALVVDRTMNLRFRNTVSEPAFGAMALGDPIALRFRTPDVLAAIDSSIEAAEPRVAEIPAGSHLGRSWSVDILPIPAGAAERPAFFLLVFRDRTGERRIERMRTDFVANASHELRTPLASVIGFIETLQGPARNDAAARDRFLEIMAEQATRMSRLIDDLLSLSRIEMKRLLRPDERADLAAVLREVGDLMAPVAAEHGVALEWDRPAAETVLVNGEHDELVQVFSNLVENACKYGGRGGRVVAGLRLRPNGSGGEAEVFVRDFGPGIAPEHVPRLTERFYRVEEDGTRKTRGTGLGLSIVRNILLRHNTRLLVDSVLGEGSTFSARFKRKA